MIELPPEFESDIKGQNLSLYPIAEIGTNILDFDNPISSGSTLTLNMSLSATVVFNSTDYTFIVGEYIRIDSEYMKITGVPSQYMSYVDRGVLGSDIAEHPAGSGIGVILKIKLYFSTKSVTLGDIHYKPLLLNIPSIKESMDFENRNYKISNVTLKISNYEYEGERFSDYAGNLMNLGATLSWVSQSESILEVYNGLVRRYSHNDETVTIQLEDSTQKDLHQDVPVARLGDGDEILSKYKLKSVPMVYGEVDYSPCVIPEVVNGEAETSSFNIIPDRTIGINEHPAIEIDNMLRDNQDYEENSVANITLYTYTDKYVGIVDSPLLQGFTGEDGFHEDVQIERAYSGGACQYAVAIRSLDDVDANVSTLNTIAHNMALVYERDDKITAIKYHDFHFPFPDGGLVDMNALPSLDFTGEDIEVSYVGLGNGWSRDFTRTTLTYSQVVDEKKENPNDEDEALKRREMFHAGDGCYLTTYGYDDGTGGEGYLYFHAYIDTHDAGDDSGWDEIMKWNTDDTHIGDNTWHSKNYLNVDGQTQWVFMFESGLDISNYLRGFVSEFRMLNSWIEKYYYIDRFQTRDFYAHVNGRTLAGYESSET